MNGVIYARYSSDNQREESIEGQIRECMEFAERQGVTVIGNYIDRALSAKTDDRPDFQRMIKDSTKQLFDVVIVWKLGKGEHLRQAGGYSARIHAGRLCRVLFCGTVRKDIARIKRKCAQMQVQWRCVASWVHHRQGTALHH